VLHRVWSGQVRPFPVRLHTCLATSLTLLPRRTGCCAHQRCHSSEGATPDRRLRNLERRCRTALTVAGRSCRITGANVRARIRPQKRRFTWAYCRLVGTQPLTSSIPTSGALGTSTVKRLYADHRRHWKLTFGAHPRRLRRERRGRRRLQRVLGVWPGDVQINHCSAKDANSCQTAQLAVKLPHQRSNLTTGLP
jgi:hypothetical protein